MDKSLLHLYKSDNRIALSDELHRQAYPKTGLYKCRILYTDKIDSVEFIPYEVKPIQSLKIVYDHTIDYALKYEDRNKINALADQRQYCDDVLIIKNGFVTDASYSNVIFFDGNQWVTPNTPLLKGTMRQFLLDVAKIKEEAITVQDIPSFKSFRLINAMLGFEGPEIDVSEIVS
jgi:4-amino-4-deoxychorismate lyase